MKTAAIYVRVSTQEQARNGLSVDNQIDSLKKYCEERKMPYRIYSDAGISGHATYKKRPALMNLISDCQKNEVSIILFTRLDRWFRSVKDYYIVQDQIGNVPWKAIWEDYTTEDSSGQLKVNIMLSVAQAEAERTSEKVKSIMQYKKDCGEYIGKAPVGYILRKGKLYYDEEKKDAVKRIFDTYLETFSPHKAVQAGLPEVKITARRQLVSVLRNETYMKDPAYITVDQHNILVDHLKAKHRYTPAGEYLFSGLIRCPKCGFCLSGKMVSSGKPRYMCHNMMCSFSVQEHIVEKEALRTLDISAEEYNKEILAVSEKAKKDETPKLKNRLKRIAELYEDGLIDRNEYKTKSAALIDKINTADLQKKEDKKVDLPTNWESMYSELDREHKKAFWQTILKNMEITSKSFAKVSLKMYFK